MMLPLVSDGADRGSLKTLLTTGYPLLELGYLAYALLGRELKVGLSLGLLEASRGRRAA